jgi:hypothetical protein
MTARLHIALLVATSMLSQAEPLDLSGDWRLALDAGDTGLAAGPEGWVFNDKIRLPNSLTMAGKGEPLNHEAKLDKETLANLHQRHSFVGPAWFQREVQIPDSWANRTVILELERVLWESRVWVNGNEAGVANSLSVPHRHDVSQLIRPGVNVITLRIDNREKLPIGIGHAYTNATQTIWNGVVGDIRLLSEPKARIAGLSLRYGGAGTVSAEVTMENSTGRESGGVLEVRVTHPDGRMMKPIVIRQAVASGTSKRAFPIELGANPAEWCEFEPLLYQMEIVLKTDAGESVMKKAYGHRSIRAKGGKLMLNGRPVFLRGTLECCIFPKTGHPDMTGVEWEKICRTLKAHGLNHLRFHSWCPPRVAFDAADKHGVYLQVELPNWSFHMGKRPEVDDYFRAEGERILAEYGGHPSFLMLCLGNELTGDYDSMDRLVKHFRTLDPDKLFTSTAFSFSPRGKSPGPEDDYFISQETTSGWVRGQGFLNQTPPNTVSDYRDGLSSVKIPLVTHEVGQYNNYPNLAEIPKYEGGALRALGYEAIRDDLEKKGRLDEAPRLTRDSGKLAALLYKEDMERALRTPGQAGIQLLDLHDFPGQSTATVGLLDSFWDSKGFITPERFREFAGPTVPLARMEKMVWSNGEVFKAGLEIAHFGKAPLVGSKVRWSLAGETGVVREGSFVRDTIPLGSGIELGKIEVPLASVIKPARLDLTVSIEGTSIRNSWPVWVYPSAKDGAVAEVEIHRSGGPRLSAALAAGKRVLLLPERSSVGKPIDARFIPVFWSPLHFPDQPGTLGASIDSGHPVFSGFPTDTFTNWQWWELFSTSFAMDLDALAAKPEMPLRFVDKYNRNALPAAIWQAKVGPGRLLVCTLDIESEPSRRIAARQLRTSILDYMVSDGFRPEAEMDESVVQSLFKQIRFAISSESEDPAHPASAAADGDASTFWHTEWKSGKNRLPATLTLDLGAVAELTGFGYAPRPDSDRGRVKQYRIEGSDDSRAWRALANEAAFPDSPDPARVVLPKPVKTRFLRLVVLSDHGAAGVAAVATFEPDFAKGDDARKLGIVPGFNDGIQKN